MDTLAPPLEDEKGKELKSHPGISRTTIHGWPSFFLGSPFLAVGIVIGCLYFGVIEYSPKSLHAPGWVLGVFGFMFFLAGASFMGHGLVGVWQKARLEDAKRKRTASPWLWDYPWHALGISENKLKEALHSIFLLVVFCVFLAPFNWWAFFSNQSVFFLKFIVCFFNLICGLGVGINFYKKWALYLKYGNSRLQFQEFPFFLGNKIRVSLIGLPANAEQVECHLRCIEERYEIRGSGRNRSSKVVCYEKFSDTKTIHGSMVRNQEKFFLQWILPHDKNLKTVLSQRPAIFWELEVKAETPGVNYHSRFLVPVYAKG